MRYPTKLLGLIGYPLEHSFSERYFNQRFAQLGYDFIEYRNFPIEEIEELPRLLEMFPEICGLNVTSPYKQQVIRYLDQISEEARKINSVNTVLISRSGEKALLKGYNTDIYGFEQALKPLLEKHHKRALILGTGGAAQAVAFVLQKLGIEYAFVSRTKALKPKTYLYSELNKWHFTQYQIIINATPLGMYPKVNLYPPIPYQFLTGKHFLFDLIYNPQVTRFLEFGKQVNAKTENGLQMLYKQAEAAWQLFEQNGCFHK